MTGLDISFTLKGVSLGTPFLLLILNVNPDHKTIYLSTESNWQQFKFKLFILKKNKWLFDESVNNTGLNRYMSAN